MLYRLNPCTFYFQDGHEMNYDYTSGMNGIVNGTELTAHVAK